MRLCENLDYTAISSCVDGTRSVGVVVISSAFHAEDHGFETRTDYDRRYMKQCSKCELELPSSSFSPSSGGKYLRPECRDCARKLAKERKDLRKQYGYPEPGYTCPICLKSEDELTGTGGNASIWVVDHDHKTNTFRGHLCHNCNRGIGVFQDNVERMKRAVQYLLP